MSKVNKLLVALGMAGKVETKGTGKTSDGKELKFDSETLEDGAVVLDADGVLADGDYALEGGKKFSIKDGVASLEQEELNTDTVTKADFEDFKEEVAGVIGGVLDQMKTELATELKTELSKVVTKPASDKAPKVEMSEDMTPFQKTFAKYSKLN